ncbi:unnamed protein product [Mortierella alpina]
MRRVILQDAAAYMIQHPNVASPLLKHSLFESDEFLSFEADMAKVLDRDDSEVLPVDLPPNVIEVLTQQREQEACHFRALEAKLQEQQRQMMQDKQDHERQMMQNKQDHERQINLLKQDFQQQQLQYFFQQLGFQQIMYSTRPAFTPSPSYQLPHLYPAPQPPYAMRPLMDAHQHQGCYASRQMHEFARPSVSVTPPTVQQRPPLQQNVAGQPSTAARLRHRLKERTSERSMDQDDR